MAHHIALALMGAGATVDFPGRPNQAVRPGQTLRGVHGAPMKRSQVSVSVSVLMIA